MADYAYTKVTGKLANLLGKIREVGVPTKVSASWLKQIGFKSSNDTTLIGVLEQIGFINSDKSHTERWKEFRGAKNAQVLAAGIMAGYRELYDLYPDAHERTESELRSFFSTRTNAGAQVISAMVATFKALASNADFSETSLANQPEDGHTKASIDSEVPIAKKMPKAKEYSRQCDD